MSAGAGVSVGKSPALLGVTVSVGAEVAAEVMTGVLAIADSGIGEEIGAGVEVGTTVGEGLMSLTQPPRRSTTKIRQTFDRRSTAPPQPRELTTRVRTILSQTHWRLASHTHHRDARVNTKVLMAPPTPSPSTATSTP